MVNLDLEDLFYIHTYIHTYFIVISPKGLFRKNYITLFIITNYNT